MEVKRSSSNFATKNISVLIKTVYMRRVSPYKRASPTNQAGFHGPFTCIILALESRLPRFVGSFAAHI